MKKTKIAALSDLHIGKEHNDYTEIFKEISLQCDIFVLCGDLTERGSKEELDLLLKQLSACTIPIVAVLGNHDYESGNEHLIMTKLEGQGVNVLKGTSCLVKDIGFAGIKGFCGGFGRYTLAPWGEKEIKEFVQVTVQEALNLETTLSLLSTEKKIVVMHYAPIESTIEGEAKELYPFLGSSRLIAPIDQYKPLCVLHGHAHHGVLTGSSPLGIPVYNVAVPVLQKQSTHKSFFILEV